MVICRRPTCKKEVEDYITKSGKTPTLCKYHYSLLVAREARRPKRKEYNKKYGSSIKSRLKLYKRKSKNISGRRTLEIIDEYAISLFLGKCRYCKKQGSDGDCNGIDRIDNNIHYIESNCVSCCQLCNHMKGTLSHNDFINHIRNIKRVTIDNVEPIMYDIKRDNIEKTYEQYYRKTAKCKLSKYKSDLKAGKLRKWELNDEVAIKLFLGDCRYCNKKSIEGEHLNGIDRIDNSIHYIESNCVSCCWICNRMKHIQSHDDFINHIQVILQNF